MGVTISRLFAVVVSVYSRIRVSVGQHAEAGTDEGPVSVNIQQDVDVG